MMTFGNSQRGFGKNSQMKIFYFLCSVLETLGKVIKAKGSNFLGGRRVACIMEYQIFLWPPKMVLCALLN